MGEETTAASLDEAWTAALANVRNPKLDSVNPHFGSRFASIKSVEEVIKEQCREKGIRYEQREMLGDDGNRYLQTVIAGYGQERKLSVHPIIAARSNDSQAFGSGMTYARRQVAQLDWGICGEADDDGEAASVQPEPQARPETPESSKRDVYIDRIGKLQAQCAEQGVKLEGMDAWCVATLGKHLGETAAMSDGELVELGKYLRQLAKDSEALE